MHTRVREGKNMEVHNVVKEGKHCVPQSYKKIMRTHKTETRGDELGA